MHFRLQKQNRQQELEKFWRLQKRNKTFFVLHHWKVSTSQNDAFLIVFKQSVVDLRQYKDQLATTSFVHVLSTTIHRWRQKSIDNKQRRKTYRKAEQCRFLSLNKRALTAWIFATDLRRHLQKQNIQATTIRSRSLFFLKI